MKTNKNSRTKNSFFNLISGFAGQGINSILKFITRTVFIYVLGKNYLGINGLFSDVLSMLSLTELGFGQAICFRLYKPVAENNAKQVRILMKFYKQVYRAVSLGIAVLGLIMIPFLPVIIKDYSRLDALGINAVLIFCLYLFQSVSSYMFFAYRGSVVEADQRSYILNTVQIAASVLTNILQIIILLVTENFILYTSIVIVVNLLQNIFNAVMIKRMYPAFFEKEKDSLPKKDVITLFKDAGAAFVLRINTVVVQSTDNIILSSFIGLIVVGMYSNYLILYTNLRVFLEKFFQACKASVANIFAVDTIEKRYFMFEVMNFFTIILYGTACVGISVISNEFITLWIGEDYVIKQPFALLIGIELLFSGLKYNLGQIRNVSGVFRQLWYRPVVGMIINLVVSIVLVQYMGIFGVVIGTIVSDLLSNFLLEPAALCKYAFNHYKSVWHYYKTNLLYIALLLLVGLADYYVCCKFFIGMGVLSLLIHTIICGVSVPTVFLTVYWKSNVCRYLRDKIKYIIAKRKL